MRLDTAQMDYFTLVKPKSLRGRFNGRHKAFLWAWLDKYNSEERDVQLKVSNT